MIRFLAAAVIVAITGGLALYFFAQHLRRTGMFFPSKYPEGVWDTSALPVKPEEKWFTTPDGLRLNAWLFRASAPNAPLLVYFHGNAGNLGERGPIAANLAAHGITVFVFDWRGYGKSDGTPTEEKLFVDALAAYDFAKQFGKKIFVYGESLGGPYAAFVAKERRDVRAVVIENSFPSLSELGDSLYAPLPLGWTARDALTTAKWLNEANVPVLVMHGKPDQVIPFKLGESLYAQLKSKKEMLVSETSQHCEIANTEGDRYYDTIARFIRNAS